MSKVSVCDICGKQIGSTENYYSFKHNKALFGPSELDMCESCFDSFIKFVNLNNKQKGE